MPEIRPFEIGDIPFAISQTAREGWDSTEQHFRLCLAHDPAGCFIAAIDGQPVGMVTTTAYPRSAWIGNLVVEPAHRFRGIGAELMKHAMAVLSRRGIETVRLDADPPGVKLYRRLGFVDEFESLRFEGQAPAPAPEVKAVGRHEPVGCECLNAIASYDADKFGDDRKRLLNLLIKDAIHVASRYSGDAVTGYAIALPAQPGVRLGPVVADNAEVAGSMLAEIFALEPDRSFVVAVPGSNTNAVDLFEHLDWRRTPSSQRMVWRAGEGRPADDDTAASGWLASGRPGHIYAIANGAMG